MPYGLTDKSIAEITAILAAVPDISEAVIYGSRAKGDYREGSDIDLSLKGSLSHNDILKLQGLFEGSSLPYQFDLSVYQQINNAALLEHINRVGIIFYQKK